MQPGEYGRGDVMGEDGEAARRPIVGELASPLSCSGSRFGGIVLLERAMPTDTVDWYR
jgi:hypothetical protein